MDRSRPSPVEHCVCAIGVSSYVMLDSLEAYSKHLLDKAFRCIGANTSMCLLEMQRVCISGLAMLLCWA